MKRIEYEKSVIEKMVRLYCKSVHNKEDGICEGCTSLMLYAHNRLDKCPYGEGKPSCKRCTTHCYSPGKRKEIRDVMRYAGPRSLVFFPLDLIKHWIR